MAGGKETPRQKMIGLMYLVLTAMLALNVDSAVLDRFIQINQALEEQNSKFEGENFKTIGSIKNMVSERGNKPEEVKIYEAAQDVRKRTAEINSYIEHLKEELISKTGGYDDSIAGTIAGAKDMDHIATMMIRQKRGDTLKTMLNEYAAYLAKIANDKDTAIYKPIALDGRENQYYSQIPNQRDKNFSQLYFESTPAAGALASFSQLQSKVMDYETEALDYLANQVGATDVSFDNIVPLVVPESRYVAAGARFKAEMYAAASASNVTPTMSWGGSPIPVNENGIGTIDIKAVGGNYDKDGRKAVQVNTKINISGQEYEQAFEYFVIKPTVQIQSAAVQALYLNCGNELFVNVPALGQEYNPTFRGKGGDAIKGSEKNKVTCIPTGSKYTLSVINDGSLIDDVTFNVRRIPKPDIVLKGDGSDVDEMKGVASPPRELSLQAVPDEDFRAALPKDARYRVSQWEVIWARGSRAVDRQTINGPSFQLPAGWRQMRPGDRIVIEIKGVQRRNFRDQTENIVIGAGQRVKQIPIN